MDEPVREAGPRIDIAQHLGDAHPWQHSVQPQRQIARRLGHGGRGAGDEQLAALDLDTAEFAAPRRTGQRQALTECSFRTIE
ncbi:MAG TPA: hypothetical protein VHO91_04620 [Rhodopila sp.]|nr:hypothetical protein [Rhodopila sp.]